MGISHWKDCGSLKKRRSGSNSSTKCFRFKWFLFQPSMFQVINFNEIASVQADLSARSLNQSVDPLGLTKIVWKLLADVTACF